MPDETVVTETDPNSEKAQHTEVGKSVDTTSGPDALAQQREDFTKLVQNVVGAKETEIRELKLQLERANLQPAVQKEDDSKYDDLVSNPKKLIREVLREELAEALKPIHEEVGTLRGNRVYENAKNELLVKAPHLAQYFGNSEFESAVRRAAGTQENINAASLYSISSMVVGQIALNNPDAFAKMTGNGKPSITDTTPKGETPSVRSDSPSAPKKSENKTQTFTLSDDEKNAAVILGKTEEQYWHLTHGSGDIESLRAVKKMGEAKK